MNKKFTLIITTVLLTFLSSIQLSFALTVDKENPTAAMKKAFSDEAFEDTDTSAEGLCSGIGDYKNEKCPPLVQSNSESFLEKDGQQEEVKVVEVVVEKPIYVPVESNNKGQEKKEEKEEKSSNGRVLGVSTVRPAAPATSTEDNSQQILLLTILMVLTLTLTLISEIRTQRVIAQIQERLHKNRGGKRSKNKK